MPSITINDPATHFTALASSSYNRFASAPFRSIFSRAIPAHLPPLPANPRILDNACGTGLLTSSLLELHPTAHINAVDIAPGMIEAANALIRRHRGWEDRVQTAVMDGSRLGFADETFDASCTMFGLFFFAERGPGEIYRTLKTGGTAIVSSWERVDWLPLLNEVQKIIKPGEELLTIPMLEDWSRKEKLVEVLETGGFRGVQVFPYEALCVGEDFDDLVDVLKGACEPHRRDVWSLEDMARIPEVIGRVLREQGERFLVVGEDGRPGIRMLAWVAVARK